MSPSVHAPARTRHAWCCSQIPCVTCPSANQGADTDRVGGSWAEVRLRRLLSSTPPLLLTAITSSRRTGALGGVCRLYPLGWFETQPGREEENGIQKPAWMRRVWTGLRRLSPGAKRTTGVRTGTVREAAVDARCTYVQAAWWTGPELLCWDGLCNLRFEQDVSQLLVPRFFIYFLIIFPLWSRSSHVSCRLRSTRCPLTRLVLDRVTGPLGPSFR